MSSLLRSSHLIDLCTPSISYDRQVQSGCVAFDNQMWEIIDDTAQVVMISNILGLTDETLVDILAWQFHVDFYDKTDDLDFRKMLVHDSIQWHVLKGTFWLVQHVLDTYFEPGAATLQEWYTYKDPLPPNYPIDDQDTMYRTFQSSDVNVPQNKFTLNGHGLINNQQIAFQTTSGSTLPAPLMEGLYYYVINASTNAFQISLSQGGGPVIITNNGTGTNQIWKRGLGTWHDRYRFRVLIDEKIIDPPTEALVIKLINAYKPISRWLEAFVRARASECDIGWTGMCLRFIYRTSEAPNYP